MHHQLILTASSSILAAYVILASESTSAMHDVNMLHTSGHRSHTAYNNRPTIYKQRMATQLNCKNAGGTTPMRPKEGQGVKVRLGS
jgi:hypothetical protein